MPQAAAVRVTRRGRRLLLGFSLAALLLAAVAAFVVLPFVSVTVTPVLSSTLSKVHLIVDLDARAPAGEVVPLRLLELGEDQAKLEATGYRSVELPQGTAVFSLGAVDTLVATRAREAAGQLNAVLVSWQTGDWTPGSLAPLGRTISYDIPLRSVTRPRYDLGLWRSRFEQVDPDAFSVWLSRQPGVAEVRVEIKPSFLANLKGKFTISTTALTLALDTGGKVSILGEHD